MDSIERQRAIAALHFLTAVSDGLPAMTEADELLSAVLDDPHVRLALDVEGASERRVRKTIALADVILATVSPEAKASAEAEFAGAKAAAEAAAPEERAPALAAPTPAEAPAEAPVAHGGEDLADRVTRELDEIGDLAKQADEKTRALLESLPSSQPGEVVAQSPARAPRAPRKKAQADQPVTSTLLGQDVLRVLSACTVEGNTVRLAPERLDPKLYKRVDEVLRTLGGKWTRKLGAHVFADDPSQRFDEVIVSGSIVTDKDAGFFPTPDALAARMVELAGVSEGSWVLEPSAGSGSIARAVRRAGGGVTCVEYDERRALALRDLGFDVEQADFLAWTPDGKFDAVVMNPPFARRLDVKHVLHAHGMVRPGGKLVAVMSGGVSFREDALTREFRATVEAHGGTIEQLPDGSFAESGTNVRTVLVTMEGPRG